MMEFDEFRRALDEAGSRPEIDVAAALERVGTRAHRRRRRQRNLASALVLVGAFAVIVVVLVVAGDGPTREPGRRHRFHQRDLRQPSVSERSRDRV